MFTEIIEKPISGEFSEKHFGLVSSNCLWVKFTDQEYKEWVGSFQQGYEGYGIFALNLDKQEKAFVVAGGKTYLIDISLKQLLNKVTISGTKSAILNKDQKTIYFTDDHSLNFIDMEGNVFLLHESHHFNEIELIDINDNILYTKYKNYQEESKSYYFEINVITKEFKDSFYDTNRNFNLVQQKSSFFYRLKKWIIKYLY